MACIQYFFSETENPVTAKFKIEPRRADIIHNNGLSTLHQNRNFYFSRKTTT